MTTDLDNPASLSWLACYLAGYAVPPGSGPFSPTATAPQTPPPPTGGDYRPVLEARIRDSAASAQRIGVEISGGLKSATILAEITMRRNDAVGIGQAWGSTEASRLLRDSRRLQVLENHIHGGHPLTSYPWPERYRLAARVMGQPVYHGYLYALDRLRLAAEVGVTDIFSGYCGVAIAPQRVRPTIARRAQMRLKNGVQPTRPTVGTPTLLTAEAEALVAHEMRRRRSQQADLGWQESLLGHYWRNEAEFLSRAATALGMRWHAPLIDPDVSAALADLGPDGQARRDRHRQIFGDLLEPEADWDHRAQPGPAMRKPREHGEQRARSRWQALAESDQPLIRRLVNQELAARLAGGSVLLSHSAPSRAARQLSTQLAHAEFLAVWLAEMKP